ncbi:MAG TPA: c-type cytochrome [Vicinamibacterales bacterium]
MHNSRALLLVATAIAATGILVSAADPPSWAYPRVPPETRVDPDDGKPRAVPGGARMYTLTQIRDFFSPPDWHDDHPPMPGIVGKGRPPKLYACGYCHLPNGVGKPENARVAGLPFAYIKQQVADFKSGARKGSVPGLLPHVWMVEASQEASDAEVDEAAKYFAALPQPKGWYKVVETETVPKTRVAGWILIPDGSGQMEPLGQRIVETAADLARTGLRDFHSGYVTYVPMGSVKKGEALVTSGGGRTMQCSVCHGPDLKGIENVPRIAGVSAIYTVRQLFDFQSGARNGSAAALMKPVVAKLSEADMVSIAAYLTSLEP